MQVVAVAVVGAVVLVLAGAAAELRHHDHGQPLRRVARRRVAQILPERRQAARELVDQIAEDPLLRVAGIGFVLVVVPAAEVQRGDAQAEVELDQLRDRGQVVAEPGRRVDDARARRVAARGVELDDVHRVERLESGLVQPRGVALVEVAQRHPLTGARRPGAGGEREVVRAAHAHGLVAAEL